MRGTGSAVSGNNTSMSQRRGYGKRNRERQPRRVVARWHFECALACGRKWRAAVVTISDCGVVNVRTRDAARVPPAQKEAAADAVADFLGGCFALTHDERVALLWG